MFACEFCEISKNTFSNRTRPVAASEMRLSLTYKVLSLGSDLGLTDKPCLSLASLNRSYGRQSKALKKFFSCVELSPFLSGNFVIPYNH